MKIIFDYNRTVYDPDTEQLFPGVLEMLENLEKDHELFLISMNELGRKDALSKLGINRYFNRVTFVDEKTEEAFVSLVKNISDTMVVGDRTADEIRIGNALGCVTVWVRQGKFGKEMPLSKQEEPNFIIDKITDLKKIISKYEK